MPSPSPSPLCALPTVAPSQALCEPMPVSAPHCALTPARRPSPPVPKAEDSSPQARPADAPPLLRVTRPQPQADDWVRQLQARGLRALAQPLIDIAPALDAAPLHQAWQALPQYVAVMFVSGAATRFFMQQKSGLRHDFPDVYAIKTRAWCTGPGTRAALVQGGWPPGWIDTPAADAPALDSEHLWPQVAAQVQPGARVLIVRGGDAQGRPQGRDWMAARIAQAGGVVEQVAAYRRQLPAWDEASRRAAQQGANDGSVWFLTSSEALQHLAQLLPQQDWAQAAALVTHPRIEARARQMGFGRVALTHPVLDAVAASIESWHGANAQPA